MIPVGAVHDAVLATLRADRSDALVGDGGPPPSPPAEEPVSWLAPLAPAPTEGPRFGGGEPDGWIRLRLSCSAVDGDGPDQRLARSQVQWLADRSRGVLLGCPLWAGEGWRVTGRHFDAAAVVPEAGAWTIHLDLALHVAVT